MWFSSHCATSDRMNVVYAAIIALLAQTALAQQPSGSIQGLVSRAGTSQPLSKATVEIRADNRGDGGSVPPDYTTTTESDGRFLIPAVRPGRYRVVVIRPGYVRRMLSVTIVAGRIEQVQASLTATVAIAGRVYGINAEPLGNVDVSALKPTYQDGRRTLTAVQTVRTDDRGEYRLFWLPPGKYYVSATHSGAKGPLERMIDMSSVGAFLSVGGNGPGFSMVRSTGDPAAAGPPLFANGLEQETERYVPVYYPGAITDQQAAAIDLSGGADAGGVDIPLAPVRARHVRGVVVNGATGQVAQYAGLQVDQTSAGPRAGSIPNDGAINPDGSFDLLLFPGPHTLVGTAGTGVGFVTFEVRDADLEGIQIVAMPAFNISGRIVADGPVDSADVGNIRLSLLRDVGVGATSSPSYSLPRPDGSFVVEATPGSYRLNVAPILNLAERTPGPPNFRVPPSLQNAYVKSIRLGEVDVLNSGLRLQGAPAGQFEVVIGTAPGAVDGLVFNDSQPAGAGVTVVLLPDVRRRTDLYKTTATDPSGRFRIDRVPPGDYRAFAWQEISDGAWHDPDVMQGQEPRGTPVRVVEGNPTSIQLAEIR
jgi:carboxypeptidase family protein